MKKPKIVICNDDGIHAKGIRNLWEAVHNIADVTIVAPAEDQSCKGVGISIPQSRFIEAEKVPWPEDVVAWKVYGTPADCAKFALDYLLDNPPDLLISGINDGSNAGRNIVYSGTIGAVIQGTFSRIPGIAFSAHFEEGPEKFKKAQPFITAFVQHFIHHPIPPGTLMNINFPSHSTPNIKGLKMAKQGQSFWNTRIGSDSSLKGTKKYPILESWDLHDEAHDSDIYLLTQGYITCVPIHVNDLTDHKHHDKHKPIFEKLNEHLFS